MGRFQTVAVVAAASILSAVGAYSLAQPEPAKPTTPPALPPEAEAWMKAAEPGEQHKLLEKLAGEWSATVKSRFTGDWQESKATIRGRMTMGGRYLVSSFQGTLAGQPLTGQQVIGFNNITKKFESVWRDNMGTGMMIESGTGAGNSFTTTGESQDPFGKTIKSKTVCTIGDGTYTVEMFQPGPDGKEAKVFEMSCTRTGDASPRRRGGGAGGGNRDADDAE